MTERASPRIRSRNTPGRHLRWLPAAVVAAFLPACDSSTTAPERPAATQSSTTGRETEDTGTAALLRQLAAARLDAANSALDRSAPDEALPLLAASLRADPSFQDPANLARSLLQSTRWHFPLAQLEHGLPVEHLAAWDSSLWVSLSAGDAPGNLNTTVRWNLESLEIGNVLFPAASAVTESLTLAPGGRFAVIRRGAGDNAVTLLCDAITLRPIRGLGPLPPGATPSAVIAFSRDSLLMAHPVTDGEAVLWHIRDAATGEIIRSSEPLPLSGPASLCARLDREKLEIFQADGSRIMLPVSPIEPGAHFPAEAVSRYLHAEYLPDSENLMALRDDGPHMLPLLVTEPPVPVPPGFLLSHPWSRYPSIWSGLLGNRRESPDPESRTPFLVSDHEIRFDRLSRSPVHTRAAITAASFTGSEGFIGTADGRVQILRFLPLPQLRKSTSSSVALTPAALEALENLTLFLTGLRFDPTRLGFIPQTTAQRSAALQRVDQRNLAVVFPDLDFSGIFRDVAAHPTRPTPPAANLALTARLAAAGPPEAPVPLESLFQDAPPEQVLASIRVFSADRLTAATALALALPSPHPEWISAFLRENADIPPPIHRLAVSRIAWLEGRKADAIGFWPDGFPDLAKERLQEDWHGWEQADFTGPMDAHAAEINGELNRYRLPERSKPADREELVKRLFDPASQTVLGRKRHAIFCMETALALSDYPQETKATLRLADFAKTLGAPPEPCLRAEALALTRIGDHRKALPRWISLITDFPLATHLSRDYAEAAYSAFENANPSQAMEILATGIHRYPGDPDFAVRAGWIALLTAHPQRAYRFLQAGEAAGFPAEIREHATALFVVAAAQAGLVEEASIRFDTLAELEPAWKDPKTVAALNWPEDLKAALRGFTRPPAAIVVPKTRRKP